MTLPKLKCGFNARDSRILHHDPWFLLVSHLQIPHGRRQPTLAQQVPTAPTISSSSTVGLRSPSGVFLLGSPGHPEAARPAPISTDAKVCPLFSWKSFPMTLPQYSHCFTKIMSARLNPPKLSLACLPHLQRAHLTNFWELLCGYPLSKALSMAPVSLRNPCLPNSPDTCPVLQKGWCPYSPISPQHTFAQILAWCRQFLLSILHLSSSSLSPLCKPSLAFKA